MPVSEGRFFEALGEDAGNGSGIIRCTLCPRQCCIPPGGRGVCGVRENADGVLTLPYHGYITAIARDPIEKKPLCHFRPGSSILSLGFAGCNLHCPFCQNWRISQIAGGKAAPGRYLSPKEAVALAAAEPGRRQIAYTYSEPLIHAEYLIDCMKSAHERGIANVLVTNGCINESAAAEILPLTDAANIDLKSFSEETYAKTLGGNFQTVLEFIRMAYSLGVHVEISTLLIPGLNDSAEELDQCAAFITGISEDIPWHLLAYHPDYRWNAPPADPAALIQAAERAQKTLRYVYTPYQPRPISKP
ncbi:AmmeMemoRadiSam system radical SAM enzyme [Spirochaetia bacterium]|nr:AmmeMemoRadiSam system radical SAM enzyme [Spirochaetia bacterium]